MEIGIAFTVFLVILGIVISNEQKKQRVLEEKLEQVTDNEYMLNEKTKLLIQQKRGLCDIILALLDMPDKISDIKKEELLSKIKKEIINLANNMFDKVENTEYNINKEFMKKLKIMSNKLLQFFIILDKDEDDFDDDFDDDDFLDDDDC